MPGFKALFLCLALAVPALTQPTVTVVATFSGNAQFPGQLIQGAGGNFYGATARGGPSNFGTIFRMTPQGGLSRLFSFSAADGSPLPRAALVQGRGGYLYGATFGGGTFGRGSIFKISRTGAIQTLHSLCQQASCPDGFLLNDGLVRGLDGWIYGTTERGGAADKGVVFRIGPHGTYEVVHSFVRSAKHIGVFPGGGLVQASDGNLYGVCQGGGAYGLGTIFMVTPPQGQVKLFYSFGPLNTEGAHPQGELIQGADGNLYGGATSGRILFKISLQGAYQKIYDFAGPSNLPFDSLLQASDGNLWGVFGNSPSVSIFAITTSGSLVQNINMLVQGVVPFAQLMQGSDGKLYGGGNDLNNGSKTVIYAIDAGLPPPVPSIAGFRPVSGLVGSEVVVSGGNYVGATGVTFNGVSASFVVNASGVISATVPSGANSGPIQVTTPGGTVTSQSDFTVLP